MPNNTYVIWMRVWRNTYKKLVKCRRDLSAHILYKPPNVKSKMTKLSSIALLQRVLSFNSSDSSRAPWTIETRSHR